MKQMGRSYFVQQLRRFHRVQNVATVGGDFWLIKIRMSGNDVDVIAQLRHEWQRVPSQESSRACYEDAFHILVAVSLQFCPAAVGRSLWSFRSGR